MKTTSFPHIALGLGLTLLLAVIFGSKTGSDGTTTLPLLTLLIASEFGAVVTAIGTYIGVQNLRSSGVKAVYLATTLLCALLSIQFLLLGIELWPL